MTIEIKPPKYLYKYKAWDETGYTRSMLETGNLWFQSHDKLNDPFEIQAAFTLPHKNHEIHNLIKKLLEKEYPDLPMEEKQKRIAQLSSDFHNKPLPTSRDMKPVGVFCMTENPRSLLMWSHYGANHEGVCIRFTSNYWGHKRLRKVKYLTNLPKFDWVSYLESESTESWVEVSLTKAQEWHYEEEWRTCDTPGEHHFSSELISAVIIGARCPNDHRKKIKDVANERGIQVFEAKLSDTRYLVEIPGLDEVEARSA